MSGLEIVGIVSLIILMLPILFVCGIFLLFLGANIIDNIIEDIAIWKIRRNRVKDMCK